MGTKRNTGYNLGGAIVPAILMLATVPVYLALIGEARYGILALVWLFTGYFAFFDFGLGRATAFAISRLNKDGDAKARGATFWTALLINAGLGVAGAAIVLLIAYLLFGSVIKVPSDLMAELSPVLPWLALAVPLLTLEGVFTGALMGRERFLALNIRLIVGAVITQLLPLFCVWWIAPTLDVAIPATIAARALSVSIFAVIAVRALDASFRPKFGGKVMAKQLLAYGGWVSAGSVLNPLIANFDRFLIGSVLGPVAVAVYAVPFQLVSRGSAFANALAPALFPRLAAQDEEEAKALALRGVKANAALMCVLCMGGIIIMIPFLTFWISAEFAKDAAIVGQIIAVTVWLNAVALIPFNYLQARGKPQETFFILLAQIIPFLAVAGLGIALAGIIGVALARNLRSFLDMALLTYRSGLLRPALRITIVPVFLFFSAIAATQLLTFANPLLYAVLLGAFGLSCLYANAVFPEGRELLVDWLVKAKHRFGGKPEDV